MLRSLILLFSLLLMAAGCTTINHTARQAVSFDQEWVVLPFVNNTETPYAGERAESVASALLYSRGAQRVSGYQPERKEEELLLPDRGVRRQQDALEWARKKGIRYALIGTVTEWRYKVGLDGEPVVGITLQVIDMQDNTVLWSGSAGKSGWSRDSVSAVAQQVIGQLLETIPAKEKMP